MDMISCQVSSISPSSGVGSCVTLFLLCWGGHGGILLGQDLVQGPPEPKRPQQPVAGSKQVWREMRLLVLSLGRLARADTSWVRIPATSENQGAPCPAPRPLLSTECEDSG